MDQSGNLYTSTFFGDVTEYSPNGSGGWTGSTIYSFNVSGEGPSPVILDAEGNLYGTFANFTNADGDGAYPQSPLIMDVSGTLYGTTASGGGSTNCTVVTDNSCGTAFELSEHNGVWQETILHDLTADVDAGFPGGLALLDGKLYGVAEVGGHFGVGVFFKIQP